MRSLGIVELLRPLVDTKGWDFVVVWKYGDDPTRFIEWMGCCCRGCCGGNYGQVKTKEEIGEQYHLAPICRDTHCQHPVRTKACEALAQLPFAMSLYSGVHGEVAISQQPRWLDEDESTGTQVLVPIMGGLIEVFATKHITKDINIIEFITAHCCVNEHLPSEEYHPHRWSPTTLTSTLTPNVHLPATNLCHSNPSSNEGSNPSNEHLSFDSKFVCLTRHEYLKQSVTKSPFHKRAKYNETSGKKQGGLSSHCGNGEDDKEKLVRESPREGYLSKNLVTERNRRNKIKGGLFTLRSLVPKITKMDRAAILGDAIDYIKELLEQVKELKDEVRTPEVEDCEKNTPQLTMPTVNEHGGTGSLPLTELNQSSSDCPKKKQMKVQAEVNHIGRRDFLIKLYCEQKQGWFSRLMEAIRSFGLLVADANVTTFDGKVLNILTVEATKQDIHPKKLKEYLIEKISC